MYAFESVGGGPVLGKSLLVLEKQAGLHLWRLNILAECIRVEA